MNETWKPVPGYDGLYEVSTHGRVRSWNKPGPPTGRRSEPRILKPGLARGYPQVDLCKNGHRKMTKVHTLVLTAFVGPCPPDQECCHADDNSANNRLTNLRWDSRSANAKEAIKHGTQIPFGKGEAHSRAKLRDSEIHEIRRLYAQRDVTQAALGKQFHVSRATISGITLGKTWAHISIEKGGE